MVPRMFARFLGLMNACGTVWIFLLMILINSDIIGRELFESPVRGTTEILSISIVGIVFLQLGHTLMNGKITRSDMRSEEHTSELQSLMRISYAVFCLKKKNRKTTQNRITYSSTITKEY